MKIVCTQENLKSGLQTISHVVGSSATLPILNNVLLQTENGMLKLSATNLEIGISTYIRCKIEQEGSVCLVGKTIIELVGTLPSGNITVSVTDGETELSMDHYHTKIKSLSAEEFPLIPRVDEGQPVVIPASELKTGFDEVVFAASTGETQPEISGILCQFTDDTLTLVGTDRYRLAEKKLQLTGSAVQKAVIIPHKTTLELSRLFANKSEPVMVHVSDTQIGVKFGETYLVSRLIDGQYPPYQQIIPDKGEITVHVDRSALATALKTSGIFSRGVGSVTMEIDSEAQVMKVQANASDIGESIVEIPCQIVGPSNSVILNYRYVLDVLQTVSTQNLLLQIIDDASPVVFRPEDSDRYLYLVMPIKV